MKVSLKDLLIAIVVCSCLFFGGIGAVKLLFWADRYDRLQEMKKH